MKCILPLTTSRIPFNGPSIARIEPNKPVHVTQRIILSSSRDSDWNLFGLPCRREAIAKTIWTSSLVICWTATVNDFVCNRKLSKLSAKNSQQSINQSR